MSDKTGMPDQQWLGGMRQFAAVRKITLNEGADKGVEALSFSTGGGLDFWVLTDRAMDIGPLWLKGTPLAWQSPAGFRNPALVDSDAEAGHGFRRGFSGFLMTCGLDNTRAPNNGMPQHGRVPFIPARVTSYGESWTSATPHLFCEGEVIQWKHQGEALRLVRRIEADVGGTTLRIFDRVENISITTQRHALLYHVNIGYPGIGPSTEIRVSGQRVFGPMGEPDRAGQSKAFSMPASDEQSSYELINEGKAFMRMNASTETLPHFQIWCDPRPRNYVLSMEPCTSARPEEGSIADERLLDEGEGVDYSLELTFNPN